MKIEYNGDFRERWSKRRELAVSIIAAAASGECIESEFERLKVSTGYETLADRIGQIFAVSVRIYEQCGIVGSSLSGMNAKRS